MTLGRRIASDTRSRLTSLWSRFVGAPSYPATAADRRTVTLVGIELPLRAATAIAIATFVTLFDYSRTFIPDVIQHLGRAAEGLRYQAAERFILFGLLPLGVVILAFRDHPARYGVRLGDWRVGAPLAVLGCAVMTPIIAVLAADPAFRAYYGASAAPLGDLLVTHTLDLAPAEFLMRGFLMFTLVRALGPVGVLVATMPFVFAHLGKPEVELFSTLFGGLAYGWLDWRTGSIAWSAAAHVYIMTLLVVLASS